MLKVSRFNSFDELKSDNALSKRRDTDSFKEYALLIKVTRNSFSVRENKRAKNKHKKDSKE